MNPTLIYLQNQAYQFLSEIMSTSESDPRIKLVATKIILDHTAKHLLPVQEDTLKTIYINKYWKGDVVSLEAEFSRIDAYDNKTIESTH